MDHQEIKNTQLAFFQAKKAGCIFAAIAAKSPKAHQWQQSVIDVDPQPINHVISEAIRTPAISTLSLIFPKVVSSTELLNLIQILNQSKYLFIEKSTSFEAHQCIALRAQIGTAQSWVSGFGPFEFLPRTRQAPYTEISFRVKPRPNYKWFMKPPIANIIHLADMEMNSITKDIFSKWWQASLDNTRKILGHPPNLKSAAKTTYSIPQTLFDD